MPFEPAAIPHLFPIYDGSLSPALASQAGLPGRELLFRAATNDGCHADDLSSDARRLIELATTGTASITDIVSAAGGLPGQWADRLSPALVQRVETFFARPGDPWIATRVGQVMEYAATVGAYVTSGWHPERFGQPAATPAPVQSWHEIRAELGLADGWLAVSPDRDTPAAPINAGSTGFWQRMTAPFDVVPTRNDPSRKRTIRARYVLEGDPNKPLLLLVHGHGSRLEELDDLVPLLVDQFCVIVPDLPGMGGYSSFVGAAGLPHVSQVSGLEFYLDFLASFLGAIGMGNRPFYMGGGSLGGNLSLLSTTAPRLSKLAGVAAWSPGSVWPLEASDVAEVGVPEFDLANLLGGMSTLTARIKPHTETRAQFFQDITAKILWYAAQPEHWYWSNWSPEAEVPNDLLAGETVRDRYLADAINVRQDVFAETMRICHWQIALEQLTLSHWSHVSPSTPRYATYASKPVLLMWGEQDNLGPEHLGPCTAALAGKMAPIFAAAGVPFRSQGFADTGHSIQNERPAALAAQIKGFLGAL